MPVLGRDTEHGVQKVGLTGAHSIRCSYAVTVPYVVIRCGCNCHTLYHTLLYAIAFAVTHCATPCRRSVRSPRLTPTYTMFYLAFYRSPQDFPLPFPAFGDNPFHSPLGAVLVSPPLLAFPLRLLPIPFPLSSLSSPPNLFTPLYGTVTGRCVRRPRGPRPPSFHLSFS